MTDASHGESAQEALLAVIVKALEPYDIPTDSWTVAEKVEPARAVLAALAPERVGHARTYLDDGSCCAIYDVGDTPLWEWETSESTVPVWRFKGVDFGGHNSDEDS